MFCIYHAIQFGQHQQQMLCCHLATFMDILEKIFFEKLCIIYSRLF